MGFFDKQKKWWVKKSDKHNRLKQPTIDWGDAQPQTTGIQNAHFSNSPIVDPQRYFFIGGEKRIFTLEIENLAKPYISYFLLLKTMV